MSKFNQWNLTSKLKAGQAGIGIIEIMVFAIIFGLVVIGVMSMISTSRQMEVESDYYRQARSLLSTTLESPDYDYKRFNAIAAGTFLDTVTMTYDTTSISGIITVVVSAEQNHTISSSSIPYKSVAGTLIWTRPDGGNDTLTLERWVTSK